MRITDIALSTPVVGARPAGTRKAGGDSAGAVVTRGSRDSVAHPDEVGHGASQRARWEHGHLGMRVDHAWPMRQQALRRADWRLLGLALDLAVPPLALLVMLAGALWLLALVLGFAGTGAGPVWCACGLLAVLSGAVLAAWAGWGRAVLAPWDLLRAPWYALSKLAIYLRFWSRRQKDWVRTDRE